MSRIEYPLIDPPPMCFEPGLFSIVQGKCGGEPRMGSLIELFWRVEPGSQPSEQVLRSLDVRSPEHLGVRAYRDPCAVDSHAAWMVANTRVHVTWKYITLIGSKLGAGPFAFRYVKPGSL